MNDYGPYGGNGGSFFADDPSDSKVIKIRSGTRIDAVQFGDNPRRGGTGGSETTITLRDDEQIESVTGYYGWVVSMIEIITNWTVYRFGTWDGAGSNATSFTIDWVPGQKVKGFIGRCGAGVDAIGVKAE